MQSSFQREHTILQKNTEADTHNARTPKGQTPPGSTTTQQPAIQLEQQRPPPSYPAPHPTIYQMPFAFANAPHHPHQGLTAMHPVGGPGGVGGVGGAAGGPGDGPSALIDPMLSAMSDGGEGLSDEEGGEGNGGSTGVKNGPPSVGGNNGINTHHLEDDDYPPDDGPDHPGMGGSGQGELNMGGPPQLDENGQPVKKKRRRQALSCTECKRRKIKCDRQNPCSPCTRRGEADRCRWITQEPVEKFVTRQEYDMLHAKVMHLEAVIAALTGGAFLGGLERLPMGPPPFGFVPPGAPGHPGYPPPGQQPPPPGEAPEGQFHNGANAQHPPPPPGAEMQNFHHYVASAIAAGQQPPPPPAEAAPKPGDGTMDVDAEDNRPEPESGGGAHSAEPPSSIPHQVEMPKVGVSASMKPAKSRKRKERHEETEVGADGVPLSPGKPTKSKAKSHKGPKGAPPPTMQTNWDSASGLPAPDDHGTAAQTNIDES